VLLADPLVDLHPIKNIVEASVVIARLPTLISRSVFSLRRKKPSEVSVKSIRNVPEIPRVRQQSHFAVLYTRLPTGSCEFLSIQAAPHNQANFRIRISPFKINGFASVRRKVAGPRLGAAFIWHASGLRR
jgi:hypothetical protein